ncbi:hypothetical protein J3B02_003029 [Coemansia erecta]|nr:hypothetical protein J3B02_003029 [Coemansia erecta]
MCQHVVNRKRKSRAHAKNIFYPLMSEMEFKNPKVFAVPEEIRRQFDGIEADIDGTFINTREDKPLRANSGPANREFTRLVDDHNETILCYRCGLSALHGLIIKCDYCPLSWHWDCLDPPLSAAPPSRKRWMCPNHADHALRNYRRYKFRKERIVDLTDLPEDSRNGAVVDVIDDDPPWQQEMRDPKVKYRISSSRIRKEFSQNALPCRIESLQSLVSNEPLIDNYQEHCEESENTANAVQPQGSDALSACKDTGSVAEWLQSIVAFQQEVARFVMSITEIKDVLHHDGLNPRNKEPRLKDKLALLSSVAARLLATPESSMESSMESQSELETASKDPITLEKTANGASIDASLSDTSSLQETALSALEELMGCNVDGASVLISESKQEYDNNNSSKCMKQRHDDMLRENRVTTADLLDALNRLLDSWPTEPKTAVSVNGGCGKDKLRVSAEQLLGDGRNKRKVRAMSLDSCNIINRQISKPSKRQKQIDESEDAGSLLPPVDTANDLHNGTVHRKTQELEDSFVLADTRAYSLIGALLKVKGADALLNFLFSD